MQFVKGGPDIPETLLQAHEEGQVVFFCGSGISYPARLPGFQGLVKQLFERLGESPGAVQQAAMKSGRYDTVIGLLDTEIVGGREIVRQHLVDILTPDLTKSDATATHEALLSLSRNKDDRVRLVTTNFDRIFEYVVEAKGAAINRYNAPLLPVPKNRWDGLVYLHGLLPSSLPSNDLDRLVISSGDFGLAYLTERWAARFVSELFRNYVVCFVGYSINDPVLRYMMDALAADRLLGESPPYMYAFGSYSKGKEDDCASEWRAKNVIPILYPEHNKHAYLHRTIRAWAETYRDGVQGKERIVAEYAMAHPTGSTAQDDFVGRLLWALSDPSGTPGKRFAENDPAPPLEWLGILDDKRFQAKDLQRFGIYSKHQDQRATSFSLTRRPTPHTYAPLMTLVEAGRISCGWDEVMTQIARWLLNYLDDPALVLWIFDRGSRLHERFALLIELRLNEIAAMETQGKTDELDAIRARAPKAIPCAAMRTAWRILLSGRAKFDGHNLDFHLWQNRFLRDGLTATLRMELRDVLAPRVVLRQVIQRQDENEPAQHLQHVKDIFDWEITLSADHVRDALANLHAESWTQALPALLPEATDLLKDALDLMQELGAADSKTDMSCMYQPSISDHPQNQGFYDWTTLIELARDSWLATAQQSPAIARSVAAEWLGTPYPVFKRLAFFAATKADIISPSTALSWLLHDDHWWLWSGETTREAMRLLVHLAPLLQKQELRELEKAILLGPIQDLFEDHIEEERRNQLVDHEVWLALASIERTGVSLGERAASTLRTIRRRNPDWQLEPDERDEFSFWRSVGRGARQTVATPRSENDLVQWLLLNPEADVWREDDWSKRCRVDLSVTAHALVRNAQNNNWPTDRWRTALQVWSEETLIQLSWREIGKVLLHAPETVLRDIANSGSRWLHCAAKFIDGDEDSLLILAGRLLKLDYRDSIVTDEPVFRAINHPIGKVTQALLQLWYREKLEDQQGLPPKLASVFTKICDPRDEALQPGRVILSAHLVTLFRVDRAWTTDNLVPLLNWRLSLVEARTAWEGFLWSPRLYRPLLEVIKESFLDTAVHYHLLSKHARQYAAILTLVSLDKNDVFTTSELAKATRELPPEGLKVAAQTLVKSLEDAGEKRSEYWTNRVSPYLSMIWPKTRKHTSPGIAVSLARVCIAAEEAFPQAFAALRPWLQPSSQRDQLVHQLAKSDLCRKYPSECLSFLDLVIADTADWVPYDLVAVLKTIEAAKPELARSNKFRRLMQISR